MHVTATDDTSIFFEDVNSAMASLCDRSTMPVKVLISWKIRVTLCSQSKSCIYTHTHVQQQARGEGRHQLYVHMPPPSPRFQDVIKTGL